MIIPGFKTKQNLGIFRSDCTGKEETEEGKRKYHTKWLAFKKLFAKNMEWCFI